MISVDRAIQFAAQWHEGQKDTWGDPYILHVLRVMMEMDSEAERIVAVLHDVLEETGCTEEALVDLGCTEQMIDAIKCLTKNKDEDYTIMIERIKINPISRKVKIKDLEHNMEIKRLKNRRNLTEKDMARLKKYLTAWTILTGY
jgi:hypothetical protein